MANNTSSLCTMWWWMWRAKCSISARLAWMTSGCLLSNAGMNLGMLKISVLSKMPGLTSYKTVQCADQPNPHALFHGPMDHKSFSYSQT